MVVVERTRAYRSHRHHPALPAQWFYGLFRALPGDRALLPPSPALLGANLTPASGRQDHTTSPSASAPFVDQRIRVHRIPSRGRDDRVSPLSVGRDSYSYSSILNSEKQKYFCKGGWT